LDRAGDPARNLRRGQECDGGRFDETDLSQLGCSLVRTLIVATKVLAGKVPCGVVDMKIFLAGATGAIGRRLGPLLLNARHYVIGTTRSTTKADGLRAAGVEPVAVDVFHAQALSAAGFISSPANNFPQPS